MVQPRSPSVYAHPVKAGEGAQLRGQGSRQPVVVKPSVAAGGRPQTWGYVGHVESLKLGGDYCTKLSHLVMKSL